MNKKIKIKELSLADLIILHNNWILCAKKSSIFNLLYLGVNFEALKKEFEKRMNNIDF